MIQLCSTGEAGSLCAHDIFIDSFSMHEKKKTESIITKHGKYEYACMRDSSTAPGQACLSLFGGLCKQTLPPSNYMYLELGASLMASLISKYRQPILSKCLL